MDLFLTPLRSILNFLELSWFRVVVLFLAWIAVGFVLYTNGGIHSILADATYFLFVLVLLVFAIIIKFIFGGFALWAFFTSPPSELDMFTDPSFSNHPGNMYHNHNKDSF